MATRTRVEGLKSRSRLNEAAPRLLSARLADVRQYEPIVRERIDEEAVHEMRVSARRLRAAIEMFDRKDEKLERQIKRLQDALGDVRDLQVQLNWFRDWRRWRVSSITRRLQKQLARSEGELKRRLAIWEGIAAEIEQRLPNVHGKGRLGGGRIRRRLDKRLRQLSRRVKAADQSLSARNAHRARISVKKVRYLAELVECAHPSPSANCWTSWSICKRRSARCTTPTFG